MHEGGVGEGERGAVRAPEDLACVPTMVWVEGESGGVGEGVVWVRGRCWVRESPAVWVKVWVRENPVVWVRERAPTASRRREELLCG